MSLILASTAGEVIVWIVWVVAALALLGSGFAVVLPQNPFYSALALILNLGSLAVLYLLLSAEFVAAAQVLVYAGAVMVMFLFVIAYLGGRADAPFAGGRSLARVAAIAASGAILVEIGVVIGLEAGGEPRHRRRSRRPSAALARSAGSSCPTTCSRSRSRPSSCWSGLSAASCSAPTPAAATPRRDGGVQLPVG